MNLYIHTKNSEEALKSGWVVSFLRFIGWLQVILCIIVGATIGGPIIAEWFCQFGIMSRDAASASALFIGLAVGIIAGLFSSLLIFAMAQVIDDLHAIRVHTAGYIAVDADNARPGDFK